MCTIPLDTAKVRLQLQKNVAAGDASVAAAPKYRGLLGTAATIAREEGAAALWKGIVPGLHRQCIYGGLRIGLYEPVRSPGFSSLPMSLFVEYLVCNAIITSLDCTLQVKSFYVGEDHVGEDLAGEILLMYYPESRDLDLCWVFKSFAWWGGLPQLGIFC